MIVIPLLKSRLLGNLLRLESDTDTMVGYKEAEAGDGDMGSLADELESVAISSVYDAGSNASPVSERSESSGDDDFSGSELDKEDERRWQTWKQKNERERGRRGW